MRQTYKHAIESNKNLMSDELDKYGTKMITKLKYILVERCVDMQ